MYGSRSATVTPNTVASFADFDFLGTPSAAGNFSASLSLSGPSGAFLWGFLCSDDELQTLLSSFDTASSLCAAADLSTFCAASAQLSTAGANATPTWAAALAVRSTVTYNFLFAACASDSATPSMGVAASWHATNPGGSAEGHGH